MNAVSIGIALADALNRERALTQWESGLVAALVTKTPHAQPLRRWTQAQDEQLLVLVSDGPTAPEIALRMGRTAWSVRSRLRTLKRKGLLQR